MSLHLPPGLSSFEDVCAESDATNSATDSDELEEHTLTAFGDVSLTEVQMLGSATNDIRRMNRLRLKVKRPPFPKDKRTSVQYSPKSPGGRLFDSSSPAPSPLSPSLFFDALRNSLRSGKRRAQADVVDVETQLCTADSRESTSRSSSDSYDYKPGQSVIVKDVSSVAEVPEPVKGWRKLPPRLPIPKWDVDN